MNCEQVRELLNAYALGAAEAEEAAALEEHVADCVRCWSSLDEAQRAAAAIALSAALRRAPSSLRGRVIAEAEKAERERGPSVRERLRRLLPVGAGVLAAGAAASLAAAVFLQTEVSDLQSDNDRLAFQVQEADEQLEEQQQLVSVLAAHDVQQVRLDPTDPSSEAIGVYHWSSSTRKGVLLCENVPALQEGEVYKVWVLTDSGAQHVGSFRIHDGVCQVSLDLASVTRPPSGIGMSIEAEDAQEPGDMLLWAELRR